MRCFHRRTAARLAALAGATAVLASVAPTASVAQPAAGSAAEPIKIGFVATLSGPAGAIGIDQYDAFVMALEQRQGRLGGVPVQLLREDDQLRPEVGNQVVTKLIEREKVPIITGLTFSNVIMAVHKRIVDSQTVLIGSNGGPSPVAGAQCSPYFFSTAFQNDGPHEAMGKYARDKGLRRLVLMAPNYQAGKDALTGFKRFYPGEVVAEVYTQLNQLDYSVELAQAMAAQPDAIYAFYPGAMGVNFVKQYAASGYSGKVPLLSAFTVEGTTLPAIGASAVGVLTGSHWAPELDTPVNRRFVRDFEARYKRTPSLYAAQSYDAALLIDAALRKTGGRVDDRQALLAALRGAAVEGTRGRLVFNNNQFPVQDYWAWEIVRGADGKPAHAPRLKALTQYRDVHSAACKL